MEWNTFDNRTVNWTIIKEVWKKYNKAGTFNKACGIHHNYFFEVLQGTSKEEHKFNDISKKTNIDIKILMGERMISLEGMEKEKWKEYIKLLNEWDECPKDNKDKVKSLKGKIGNFRLEVAKMITKQKMIEAYNPDLFSVICFAKDKIPFKDNWMNLIDTMTTHMNKLDWKILISSYDVQQANEEKKLFDLYYEAVQKQHQLLNAIKIYKEYNK